MFDFDGYISEIRLPRWRIARVGCRSGQLFAAQFTLGVNTRAAIKKQALKFRRRWATCLQNLALHRLWAFYPNAPTDITIWSFNLPKFGLTYRRCICCRPSFLFFYLGRRSPEDKKINHQIRPCNRPVCPFCFARRAQWLFICVKRVLNQWRRERTNPVVLTYRTRCEFVPALSFSPTAGCDAEAVLKMSRDLRKVIKRHCAAYRQLERSKQLRKTLGSLWRVVVIPAEAGWFVETRQVIALPRSVRATREYFVQLDNSVRSTTTGTIARLTVDPRQDRQVFSDAFYQFFGEFCRYPETLLSSHAELIAVVLWATANLRSISATGAFQKAVARNAALAATRAVEKNFAVKKNA